MNKYELPYSAEIRTKHCEPDDEINFGERYCTICGCVLNFDEALTKPVRQEAVNSKEFNNVKKEKEQHAN